MAVNSLAMATWREAISEFRTAIRLDRGSAEARYLLGNALASKNDWQKASDEYQAAAYLNVKFSKAPDLNLKLIRAYDQLGVALQSTAFWPALNAWCFGGVSLRDEDGCEIRTSRNFSDLICERLLNSRRCR